MNTGDQISPPGGYVGGGLQMQTDIAVDPAGNVWAMNNWQDIGSCIGKPQRRSRPDAAARVSRSSTAWESRSVRHKSDLPSLTTERCLSEIVW
jgi:hypothetical protein